MSEIDEIARDTGRTFRDVLTVAGQWLRTLRSADGQTGKLTRKQRRELAEQIMAKVKAERVTAAWYTKRVADYRSEHSVAQYRREADPFYTERDAAVDTERLDAMRLRIEESLGSSVLGVERRGQVVMALDKATRHPYTMNPSFGAVFAPMNERDRRDARAAAVESEQWVSARTQELEHGLAGMTVHEQPASPRPSVEEPSRSVTGPQSLSGPEREAAIGRDLLRDNAIQAIRHSQMEWLQTNPASRHAGARADYGRRVAAEQAAAAGLSVEQVRWEFANAETNSRCRVTIASHAPNGTQQVMRGYFPSETEAAAWTHDAVQIHSWTPGTTLAVRARETGRRHPFYVAEGNRADISRSVSDWHRDTHPEQTQPPDHGRTRENPDTGTDPQDLERRVLMLQRGLDAVTTDRDQHKKQLESVHAELDSLKNSQLRVSQDMRDLRSDLDAARADRDRYRGERDEAVTKLRSERAARDPQPSNGADKPRPQMSR
ncbi:hypothetical protein [Nocardia sp. NPDC004711]